jgi:hypothetical protein
MLRSWQILMNEKKKKKQATPPVYQTGRESCFILKDPIGIAGLVFSCWKSLRICIPWIAGV